MFKVGDKLLCKKTDYGYAYKKGIYYEVAISKIYGNIFLCYIKHREPNNNKDDMYGVWFSNVKKATESVYAWDIFYKPEELRKNKLKTII